MKAKDVTGKQKAPIASTPASGSASAAKKRIVIEVDENSVTVTRPNEMTWRENDRLDYGLRQAIKDLRDLRKTQPRPNDDQAERSAGSEKGTQ